MVFARVVTRCALALDLDPHASGGRLELEVVTQVQRQAQGVEPRSEVRRGRRDPDRCPGALDPHSPMACAAAAMSASITVGVRSCWDRAVDRKSTRLNSSHVAISYAVFCLKKKNTHTIVEPEHYMKPQ